MEKAGCHVVSYHSLNPMSIKWVNHRNHRRVLVVDGRVGFTGGTSIGDKWTGDGCTKGHWRQTDVRVEGPIVRSLQTAFTDRSFQLNNELNVAFLDKAMAALMTEIFRDDLKYTRQVTYEEWQRHAVRNAFNLPLIPLRDQL